MTESTASAFGLVQTVNSHPLCLFVAGDHQLGNTFSIFYNKLFG